MLNPTNCEGINVTLTIPSNNNQSNDTNNNKKDNDNDDYKKDDIPYHVKYIENSKDIKTTHNTFKVILKDKVIFEGKYFTIQSLNDIFGEKFINGHLVVYIDGKVVFNATVDDDITTIIFEIIDSLLDNHELKVEYTVDDNTKIYSEDIIIN